MCKPKMRNLILITALFLCSISASAERISTSDESLARVAEVFLSLIETIDPKKPPNQLNDQRVDKGSDGYFYLKGYRFSYQVTPEAGFKLKIYGIKRTFTIFSIFECANWLEYNPLHTYPDKKVLKVVGGWALVEACHA